MLRRKAELTVHSGGSSSHDARGYCQWTGHQLSEAQHTQIKYLQVPQAGIASTHCVEAIPVVGGSRYKDF